MTAELSHAQEITVPLGLLNRQNPHQPNFAEMSYAEMVNNLSHHFKQLAALMTTPAVIRCEELASLRRRTISPEIGTLTNNRFQVQLRLAADLLRLGRRQEGFGLLKTIEDRLTADPKQLGGLSNLLWIALLRATAGDKQGAFRVVSLVTAQSTDMALDSRVVNFFLV